ncbi:MAG: hypothetical protein R6W06_06780 [Prochlorococcaceae cyanobacterium]
MAGPIAIGIPTLSQYALLERLCRALLRDAAASWDLRLLIVDNGGQLRASEHGRRIEALAGAGVVEIHTPPHNLGVAGSWNLFARELGRCIIANDDVTFGAEAIAAFAAAAARHPQAVILESDDPVGGFATFLLHRPAEWLALGGFDEAFNPAYFEDNDARRRLALQGLPTVAVPLPGWQHNNSSTLANSSEAYQRQHWCLFKRNLLYYRLKWGGEPGAETYRQPFQTAGEIPAAALPQAAGDLADRLTILEIRAALFRTPPGAALQAELQSCRQALAALSIPVDPAQMARLKGINGELWQIRDQLRLIERQGALEGAAVELLRDAERLRQLRRELRRQISEACLQGTPLRCPTSTISTISS